MIKENGAITNALNRAAHEIVRNGKQICFSIEDVWEDGKPNVYSMGTYRCGNIQYSINWKNHNVTAILTEVVQ